MIDIRSKPVWQLTSADIDLLDPQERQWAVSHIGYLRESGALAVISANPAGTAYETIWDGSAGAWKMRPVCVCGREKLAERFFVNNYLEELAGDHDWEKRSESVAGGST